MTLKQLFVQTALTFVAAGLGAVFGAFLTRWTEKYKQLQALRAAAYVDFLRGVSKLGVVQKDAVRGKDSFLEERDAKITWQTQRPESPSMAAEKSCGHCPHSWTAVPCSIRVNGCVRSRRCVN